MGVTGRVSFGVKRARPPRYALRGAREIITQGVRRRWVILEVRSLLTHAYVQRRRACRSKHPICVCFMRFFFLGARHAALTYAQTDNIRSDRRVEPKSNRVFVVVFFFILCVSKNKRGQRLFLALLACAFLNRHTTFIVCEPTTTCFFRTLCKNRYYINHEQRPPFEAKSYIIPIHRRYTV